MQAVDGYDDSALRSCSHRRKEARRRNDPHGSKPFKRFYIGPSPVNAHAATSVAHAIAEDSKIEKPTAIGVAGVGSKDGGLFIARASLDSAVRPYLYGKDGASLASPSPRPAGMDTSPRMQRGDLSALRVPRSNKYSHYVERPSLSRRMSRESSFASARSMPDSVLSEGDLEGRRGEDRSPIRKGLRRDASAMASFNHQESPSFMASTPTGKKREVRRRESQSSYEYSSALGRKKLSFEVPNAHAQNRRGRSESAVAGGSILHKEKDRDGFQTSEEAESSPRRPLPQGSGHEVGASTRNLSPSSPAKKGSRLLHPLRPSASHRSLGQASKSSTGAGALDGYQTGPNGLLAPSTPVKSKGNHGSPAKHSDLSTSFAPEADSSVGFETSESARREMVKERARMRYSHSRLGQEGLPPRTTTHMHTRDPSRQSRMSRASTAGTFASIGTRFSDGSFGATGGVRSRLAKTFGGAGSKSIEARARDLKLEHKRHGRRSNARGGVIPGAVGTSAGGTKWVGQTFEVGKRFWEVVESREEELNESRIEEEAFDEERSVAAAERKARENAMSCAELAEANSRQDSTGQSKDAVLDSFAKQAQEATDEHESPQGRRLTSDTQSAKQLPTTPALTFTGSDSDYSRKEPQTPPKPSQDGEVHHVHFDGKADVAARKASPAPLTSIPHNGKGGVEHQRSLDIENRQGWSDVVSFMSAKSGGRKSREAADSHGSSNKIKGALVDSLGANTERKGGMKSRQDEARSELSRDTIREASTASNDGLQGSADEERGDDLRRITSAKEALRHPEAPLGVEDQFPQATYELLRQPSDPGVRPQGSREDAASDHQIIVAARPTSDSPKLLTSTEILSRFRWDNPQRSSSSDWNCTTSPASKDGHAVERWAASSSPLLGKEPPASPTPFPDASTVSQTAEAEEPGMLSILQDTNPDASQQRKKSVKFQGASSLPATLNRGFSTSFFLRNSLNEKDSVTVMGGRSKRVAMGDAAPAPPLEVLSRNATPDGLASPRFFDGIDSEKAETMVTRHSALKRDRMLVRLAWTPSEDLPKEFNERESRKYPIYSDPFKEFMVVYRTGRLELWEDPSFVSKCLGQADQLKLHAATALKRGRAFVSMYSPIDRIFCLTFTKDDDYHHRFLDLRRSGTCIWIFDARSMTIGADWMWELSRELGVEVPENLDVHLPGLSVRVRIPVPEEMPTMAGGKGGASIASEATSYLDGGEGYKLISRDHVKKVVRKVIEAQAEWQQLCQNAENSGLKFELAWRNEATLDWITEDVTNGGQRRDWAVLIGSMLSEYKRPSVLEYRPALHYPTYVRMPKGELLDEPAGIEGFLWRVKAVSGALTRLYVTTHDGLIFVNRPSRAFPPDRHLAANIGAGHVVDGQYNVNSGLDQLERERRRKRDAIRGKKKMATREESLADLRRQVMATVTVVAATEEEVDAQIEAYRAFEKRRQFEQVNNADGYVDVRDIILIKSLDDKGPIRRPSADERCEGKEKEEEGKERMRAGDAADTYQGQEGEQQEEHEEEEEEEEEDLGGEEGLALAKDRAKMKRNRQFEVTLTNGRSIRFEAYSKSVAREWVESMANLARYWKRREKVDALNLMMASGLSSAIMGKRLQDQRGSRSSDRSTDGERVTTVLGDVWNWCLYHSCRGILKSGRLFQKKKAFAGFASRFYILIAGRLLHYKLMTSNRTARARQNSGIFHKRQETVVHLRDAYVYSGKLTEDMLVNGRSEGAGATSTFGRGTGGAASASTRHVLPRVYGDGLMSVDDDEDCTFVIRYRPQRVNQAADPKVAVAGPESLNENTSALASPPPPQPLPPSVPSIPVLGDKTYNHLVLRARSKLERDLWVRAINIECERLNREDYQREEKIRETGKTPYKTHIHHH